MYGAMLCNHLVGKRLDADMEPDIVTTRLGYCVIGSRDGLLLVLIPQANFQYFDLITGTGDFVLSALDWAIRPDDLCEVSDRHKEVWHVARYDFYHYHLRIPFNVDSVYGYPALSTFNWTHIRPYKPN